MSRQKYNLFSDYRVKRFYEIQTDVGGMTFQQEQACKVPIVRSLVTWSPATQRQRKDRKRSSSVSFL